LNTIPIEADKGGPEEQPDAPSLEALLERIPASNREVLDELFRGKFIGVRKIDTNGLK